MQDEKKSIEHRAPRPVGGWRSASLEVGGNLYVKGCGLEVRGWRLEAKRSLFEVLLVSLS
jgi:hypothetical protein